MSATLPKPRGFEAATRLEVRTSHIPRGDRRKLLVDEIQKLVAEVNGILMRRDGLPYSGRTKEQIEESYDRLAEQYAEKMVVIEEKNKELQDLEKEMKIPDLAI